MKISLNVTEQVVSQVDDTASILGITRSECIRHLIYQGLMSHKTSVANHQAMTSLTRLASLAEETHSLDLQFAKEVLRGSSNTPQTAENSALREKTSSHVGVLSHD